LSRIPSHAFEVAEDLCRLMHVGLAAAVAALPENGWKLLANWDLRVAAVLLAAATDRRSPALADFLKSFQEELGPILCYAKNKFPAAMVFPECRLITGDWLQTLGPVDIPPTPSSQVHPPACDSQPCRFAKQESVVQDVDFRLWGMASATQAHWNVVAAKATTLAALLNMHRQALPTVPPAVVMRRSRGESGARAFTLEALGAGALFIPVAVTAAASLVERTVRPHVTSARRSASVPNWLCKMFARTWRTAGSPGATSLAASRRGS